MIRFDLEIRRGAFHLHAALDTGVRVAGLFGPSGCGKTTVLMALAGLLHPERGSITVAGTSLCDTERGIFLPPEHRRIGFVFQEGRLFPHRNVRENLLASRPPRDADGPGFDEVVDLLDIAPLLGQAVDHISGGEARRVAIGRALLSRPRILLLDEPLTGLDRELRRRILAYLIRLKNTIDLRMFYVSHVYSDFLALVDHMGVLRGGRMVAAGEPESMMEAALGGRDAGPMETTWVGTVRSVSGAHAVVESEGAELSLPLPGAVPGRAAYLSIGAREVLLGVGDPPRTSARNALTGPVVEIRRFADLVLVRVQCGPGLWAEVTEDAVDDLGLAPGRPVYALIKATAIRGVAL